MKFEINTIDDFDVKGKTVLLRVDINQPVDRQNNCLKDITRIRRCAPTIKELSEKGARVVVMAHQGSDIEYQNYHNLSLHAKVISDLIAIDVGFVEDVCGPYARNKIQEMKDGQILLLDNVRFMAEEMTLFETKLKLTPEQMTRTQAVSKLAPLGDLFIVDAFAAAHRAQPTLMGFSYLMPCAMGRLFEEEYSVLAEILEEPKKPLVFLLGGAKIADAFQMMDKVLVEGIADKILAGGLVGEVMLLAKGIDLGKPSLDFILNKNLGEFIEKSKDLLATYGDRIVLPVDLAYVKGTRQEIDVTDLPVNESLLDIGSKTTALFSEEIKKATTVFVNGPAGVFEEAETELGTKELWQAVADTDAFTVIGGGDSVAATNKYGLSNQMDYVCTGGGALVRFLSGEELPIISALKYGTQKYGGEKR